MQNLQDIIQQKVINEINTQRDKPIKNLIIQFVTIQIIQLQKSNANWKSSSDLSDVNVIRQSQGIQSVPVTRNRQVEMELKIRSSQFIDKLDAKEIWKRRKDYQNKVKQFHLPKIKEYKRNFSILEKKDEQSFFRQQLAQWMSKQRDKSFDSHEF
ncbi:hypothetical protein pb186bvf_008539 [Paramecium bursaria]